MMECMKSMAKKSQDEPVEMENERMKVSHLDIIVTMIDKKPYYEIKYKEIGSNHYSVGYSSYKLENVLAWRDECFEIMTSPQTNADRIRSMTDEELVEWIANMCEFERNGEPYKSIYNFDTDNKENIHNSYGDLLIWLKAEGEE